jgi:hypothetical protein
MSFGSRNPELLDEITIDALPEPWKTMVIEDEIDLYAVPDHIYGKAMSDGLANYWSKQIDDAMMRKESEDLCFRNRLTK